ncbi:MAG TPA: tRNA pseudouridine(38-40) synthase TruA [Acidimicrobiia bacterium]|nr:tRNA pseudouridine(38-40) synthase TruA [Acidimicrobiia bacterium]
MPVVRLDLSYDGSNFHGFARQPNVRTVQGWLEEGLAQVLGESFETIGAGRTDRGVHARHQVVSFDMGALPDLGRLRRSLDGVLGPEVSVWSVTEVPDGFSARFSPVWRSYRYFIDPRPATDPLVRGWTWHVGRPLDGEAMNRAAGGFVGEHDFASFCRQREAATSVREVLEAGWAEEAERFVFRVRARAFCHQMVRSLVGFCVDVGLGRAAAASVGEVIAARDRHAVGTVAPPHGLVLWEVGFGQSVEGLGLSSSDLIGRFGPVPVP